MGDGFIKNRTGELARGVLTRMDAIALVGVAALAAYLSSVDVVISRLWCGCLLLVPGFGPAYLIIFIARAFVIVYGLGDRSGRVGFLLLAKYWFRSSRSLFITGAAGAKAGSGQGGENEGRGAFEHGEY